MNDPGFDRTEASRWFAMQTNNDAWTWLEANPTGDPMDPIVHLAHASFHHWREIGALVNQARAAVVVANVHAAVGNGELCQLYAQESMRLLAEAGGEGETFDRAFAHDSYSRGLAVSGDERAAELRQQARELGDQIDDAETKAIFDGWFARSPGRAS